MYTEIILLPHSSLCQRSDEVFSAVTMDNTNINEDLFIRGHDAAALGNGFPTSRTFQSVFCRTSFSDKINTFLNGLNDIRNINYLFYLLRLSNFDLLLSFPNTVMLKFVLTNKDLAPLLMLTLS